MKKINFIRPFISNKELINIKKILPEKNLINNGYFYKKCVDLIKKKTNSKQVFLTNNCTSAVEASLLALNLKKNDEVIIQSYTFVSIVDILYKLSIKFKFCDIDKYFVIDLKDLAKKINKNTKAIILTHYNGNSVNFDLLKKIVKNKKIAIIEDAAQAYGAKYKNAFLGSFGDFSCFSFHQTKNLHCGTGGALILNNKKYLRRLKYILDRGTNSADFYNKKSSKYTWVSKGISSQISEMQTAFLFTQLKNSKKILHKRSKLFFLYKKHLGVKNKYFTICNFNNFNKTNFHIFYIMLKNKYDRPKLIKFMNANNIEVTSHYEPLHSSKVVKKYIKMKTNLKNTDLYASSILRLPLHLNLNDKDIKHVSIKIKSFFKLN